MLWIKLVTLLPVLAVIESGNNPNAVGDNGKSIGILQIGRAVVVDVNAHFGTQYRWPEDCYDPMLSAQICHKYLSMHAGDDPSYEKLARIWNGGPKGHTKEATKRYWLRVQALLPFGIKN